MEKTNHQRKMDSEVMMIKKYKRLIEIGKEIREKKYCRQLFMKTVKLPTSTAVQLNVQLRV